MTELENLKKRAAERQKDVDDALRKAARGGASNVVIPRVFYELMADLDRAIAIAASLKLENDVQAYDCLEKLHADLLNIAERLEDERDKARAAALMLRDALNLVIGGWVVVPLKRQFEKTLADTEWVEQYRDEHGGSG